MATKAAAKTTKEKPSQPAPQKSQSPNPPAAQQKEKPAAPSAPAAQVSQTSQAATVADAPAAVVQAPVQASMGVRMPRINDVKVAGRLTADPEIKTVGKQNVANFNLAVEKPYLDAQNKWQKQVSFVPVALWGAVADRAKGFLHKGSPVYLEGRLRSSSWQTRDGQNRSMLRLEAFKIQSLAKGQSKSQGQEIGG